MNVFTEKSAHKIRYSFLIVFINAIVLLSAAFYNQYPLLDWDSGTYILGGFNHEVPWDRPILYSLLVRVFSIGNSLWSVVVIQAVLLSFLINELIDKVCSIITVFYRIFVMAVLVFTTSISLHTGFIMADVTTALSFLLMVLMLLEVNYRKVFLLGIGIIVLLPCHLSNVYSSIVFIFIVSIFKGLGFFKMIPWRSIFRIPIAIGFSVLVLLGVNFWFTGEAYISKASHVFLMGRLSENGILKSYLDKSCGSEHYAICKYKDSLPDKAVNFLFLPNSPLNKEGGWARNKTEYSTIIQKTFLDRDLIGLHLEKSAEGTFEQFFELSMPDSFPACDEGSPPFEVIKIHMPGELERVRGAVQYSGKLAFYGFNKLQDVVFIISLVVVFLFIGFNLQNKQDELLLNFACFVLILLLANAFICGTFANVVGRLQSRISWMLVLVAIMIVHNWVSGWCSKAKS